MKFAAKASGTCGELVQGYLDGKDFLINSPISFFAEAKISVKYDNSNVNTIPANYTKVEHILNKLLKFLNIQNTYFNLEMNSMIPRGKGLASSTAELTAAILAACNSLNYSISNDEISKLLIDVDGSSDGVYLPGIAHFNHLTGEIFKIYEQVPPLSFIIIDVGGEVKTHDFDRNFARAISMKHELSIRRALDLIDKGFTEQNSKFIAQAATLSSRVNQHVLHKPPLEMLIEGTREFGGLGVNCGHTGTVLGVMFDHLQTDAEYLLERVKELIHPLPIIGVFPLLMFGRMDAVVNCN